MLERTLEKALQGQGFTVVFQPIVTNRGHCLGFEALSRFASGDAPDVVWRHATTMGYATALDAMAIHKALDAGRDLPGHLFLNLSVINRDITERITNGVEPGRVTWEITEETPLSSQSVAAIQGMRAQGHAIAMDDAGTGRSTVARLQRLRPDVVKLDKELVQQWAHGNPDPLREWVQQIKQTGATVLAEGIEVGRWIDALVTEGVRR